MLFKTTVNWLFNNIEWYLYDPWHTLRVNKMADKNNKINDEKRLKVHQCRFENLPICSCLYENNIPENFAFLILGILELYARKVCKMFVYKHTEAIEVVKN